MRSEAAQAWPVRRLTDVVSLPTVQVDPRDQPYSSRVLLAPDHVEAGTGRILKRETAAEQGASSGKYVVQPGDVVFSKIRPALRKAVLADFSGTSSADMYPLRPGREILGSFLVSIMLGENFSRYVGRLSGRTGIPKVNRRDLSGYFFSLPPLAEQRRIVEVIEAVSNQEWAIEALIAKLGMIEASLMEELLSLECVTFENALDFGPQNGIYKPAASYGLEGTPIVRIDSFNGGPSDFTRNLARVSLAKGELERYCLSVGDVIVNRVNTPELVGKSTTVGALMESTVFESNMMRCKVIADRALPAFVEVWLGSYVVKGYFRARAKSAISQASINGSDVRGCPFPKLPIIEQRKFLHRLSAVRDQLKSERSELEKLRDVKRGVIDELLG